ncbi:hypothetical protein U1737_10180 [Sphingomonas sp. LB3N6]|uniref:hypothetical protein n=1 Tax=Sphingomonas fucosidasi TaxID=3096164 RepID=UPI002FC8E19B
MTRAIKAVTLTDTQLRMLDIGAPVIVSCETLTGETVAVRLQTRVLVDDTANDPATSQTIADPGAVADDGAAISPAAGWTTHGAYVAVMPAGVDYGS